VIEKLLAWTRRWITRSANAGSSFQPYKNVAVDQVYNLLFCDDLELFRANEGEPAGDLAVVLSAEPNREALEKIANDPGRESRVRTLAFNRLRAANLSVPSRRLLGVIVEVPQKGGLDVLAAFTDGSIRHINQTGKLAVFERAPEKLAQKLAELIRVSQIVVNKIGPWNRPRLPPPGPGKIRMTFLVSDGLYFGEGPSAQMQRDRFASPVLRTAAELLELVVETALDVNKGME